LSRQFHVKNTPAKSVGRKNSGGGPTENEKPKNNTIKPPSTLSVPNIKIQGAQPHYSPLPTPITPASTTIFGTFGFSYSPWLQRNFEKCPNIIDVRDKGI